jgi:hypothetical protein
MSQHSLTRVAASMQRHAARTAVSCSLTNTLARCMSSAAAAVQPAPSAASAAPSPLTPAAARPRIYTSRNRVSFSLPKEKAGAATQSKQKAVLYPLDSALSLVKSLATASFDETVALTVRLNLDPRKPNQSVRGAATLPAGTGKAIRVAVFAKGEKAQEAKAAGADIVGEKDLADAVSAWWNRAAQKMFDVEFRSHHRLFPLLLSSLDSRW